MKIQSPYEKTIDMKWLRGNLHAHTTRSDGNLSPIKVLRTYEEKGYHWLSVSDHDQVTPEPKSYSGNLLFIPGNEISANGSHLLHIGASTVLEPLADRQTVIRRIRSNDGLATLNHPNWGKNFNHWPQELIENLEGFHGIEIYNAVIRRLEGNPLATDRWDRLLSKGKRVWGFANDDSHTEDGIAVAWNAAAASVLTVRKVLDALEEGRFYATTGVELTELESEGSHLRIRSSNGSLCVVLSDWGVELARIPGNSWDFDLTDFASAEDRTYVRFEILGDRGMTAWTQPIFFE